MLVIVPISSNLARIVRAGTPMASENVRTVQGNCTTTLSFRGAAVLVPVRLMRVFLRVMTEAAEATSSSSPP